MLSSLAGKLAMGAVVQIRDQVCLLAWFDSGLLKKKKLDYK